MGYFEFYWRPEVEITYKFVKTNRLEKSHSKLSLVDYNKKTV